MTFRTDLAGIPEQFSRRLGAEGGALPRDASLVLAGMGGSAASGDFFQLCLEGRRDVRVLRDPALPSGIAALIVLSYSGETEESLSVWRAARERGVLRGAVTSGGTLWRWAEEEGCPRVLLPGGLAPRNAIGHLMQGLRSLAGRPEIDSEWTEASPHLASIRDRIEARDAAFEEIVERLAATRLPVLLSGDALTWCVARRWRASLAENAKVAATVWELPEAAHNRIITAGRDGPRRDLLGLFALGVPRDPRARVRWDAVQGALEANGAVVLRVHVPHAVPWIEALGLAYLGDWMSVRLAERLGVDPEPITLMTDVKSRLGHGKERAS